MDVGEHVMGRLVPIQGGHIFETQPVRVPARLAHAVAADPAAWVSLLSATVPEPGDHPLQTHGLHYQCFVSDVPPVVWQLVVDSFGDEDVPEGTHPDCEAVLARAVLTTARHALDHMRSERPSDAVDVWPCLAAALLTPYVVTGLAKTAGARDAVVLRELVGVLAEPASSVCRDLAAEISRAA